MNKQKITEQGQPCRKCNTPVRQVWRTDDKVKPGQKYYFEYWFECPGCSERYMVESAKVKVDEVYAMAIDPRGITIRGMKKQIESGQLTYKEYLKTPIWKELRRRMIRRADNACQVCNSNNRLNVHHRNYDRLGYEQYSDLIVLCRDCHAKFHDKLP